VAIFASSRTSEEEKHVSRITFYKLFVTHLLFVGGTGGVISNPNIVKWIPSSRWKDGSGSLNNGWKEGRWQAQDGVS
jgi:hypothetical protein